MNKENMLAMANFFGLPQSMEMSELLNQAEISELVKHIPPYLALTDALCGYRKISSAVIDNPWNAPPGEACFVFAKACYSEVDCDGHYPGCPALPLTEIARSMDQAAALFAVYSGMVKKGDVPLLRRITKLKGASIEKFDTDNSYWIWVSIQNGEITTGFYINIHKEPVVTISGWLYDGAEEIEVDSAFPETVQSSEVSRQGGIDRLGIMNTIPQAPPFLILDHAAVFQDESGRSMVHSGAHVLPEIVSGHLGTKTLLGPMHYSRALAQSGMVLCAKVFGSSAFVPEVASAAGLWYDTGCYYDSGNDIRVKARIEKFTDKRSIMMAVVSGTAYCCDRKVYGAESLNYIMIPRNQHPATMEKIPVVAGERETNAMM